MLFIVDSGDANETVRLLRAHPYGAEAVKTIAENTRMYAGYNFSRAGMDFSVDVSSITADFGGGFSIEIPDLNASVYDNFIYVGLDHVVKKNKTLTVYTGYGLKYHKIIIGTSYTGRFWEYGRLGCAQSLGCSEDC